MGTGAERLQPNGPMHPTAPVPLSQDVARQIQQRAQRATLARCAVKLVKAHELLAHCAKFLREDPDWSSDELAGETINAIEQAHTRLSDLEDQLLTLAGTPAVSFPS